MYFVIKFDELPFFCYLVDDKHKYILINTQDNLNVTILAYYQCMQNSYADDTVTHTDGFKLHSPNCFLASFYAHVRGLIKMPVI